PDGQVLATGSTAFDLDVVDFIVQRTPVAVAAVVLVTYIVLFMLTGSVVLPLKAVITNLASISASFGALVFVFQQGHFSDLLGFTPQSIDPSIPVILFSIVFGMSMDYEVLLIVRILIVPSVMRILGRANWWAPRPLRWLHDRLGTGEIARPSVQQPAIP